MSKKLLMRFFATLIIVALGHSVFWFFKAGQLEKHINNFVASNSKNISVGSFDVSGFPLSQTITIRDLKFSIPNSALSKNKVVLKKLEATSEIFKTEFDVNLTGSVIIFDKNNKISNVEFMQKPKAKLVIAEGKVSDFSYSDNGYRIFDSEKKVVYRSESANLHFKSIVDDFGKITSKVNLEIKEIEGFDIMNIYQNAFEDKVVDGIKTGEISLGSTVAQNFIGDQFSIAVDEGVIKAMNEKDEAMKEGESDIENSEAVKVEAKAKAALDNIAPEAADDALTAQKVEAAATEVTKDVIAKTESTSQEVADAKSLSQADKVADKALGSVADVQNVDVKKASARKDAAMKSRANKAEMVKKETVAMVDKGEAAKQPEVDAVTTEAKDNIAAADEAKDNVATNTAENKDSIDKIQVLKEIDSIIKENTKKVAKNSIVIDVEYYLIPINSDKNLTMPLDPSKLQVEQTQYNKSFQINKAQISNSLYEISINGQVNQFQDDVKNSGYATVKIKNFSNLIAYFEDSLKKIANDSDSTIKSFDASSESDLSQDAYRNFLRKISVNFGVVASEISAKNQLSTEEVAVLEMRREKNLDLVVNETPIREILGKF